MHTLFSYLAPIQCNNNEKSTHRDANTVCQKVSPRHSPLPGGAGLPKFNQLEMVTTCTYRPSLVKIDARNFELLS